MRGVDVRCRDITTWHPASTDASDTNMRLSLAISHQSHLACLRAHGRCRPLVPPGRSALRGRHGRGRRGWGDEKGGGSEEC